MSITVNSTGDGSDANAGDGVCNAGSGACTLRAAIEEANASSAPDTLTFNIPGAGVHVITPTTELPAVQNPASNGDTPVACSSVMNPRVISGVTAEIRSDSRRERR